MPIDYRHHLTDITPTQLQGFFAGWPHPPSPAQHLTILQNSSHVVLALDGEQVVGFINALSDGLLSAYIPLLEVLPAYQRQGIGTALLRQLLDRLQSYYAIDLICDPALQPFYEQAGGTAYSGIIWRKRDWG